MHPLSFDVPSLTSEYLQEPAVAQLVEFFRSKGLPALKQEDREEIWYQDWLDYQTAHGIYASLLSPQRYSSRGHHFSLKRLTRFLEIATYFSPAHTYSLHVSFLGLFPILMSGNEALKREAIAKLEAGGLFAFAVSEQAHGADLLANEFTVRPDGADGFRADGSKYYIGNANAASIVSILGKKAEAGSRKRAPFVFMALRPREAPAYGNVQKIRTLGIRAAFVGSFEVKDHALPAGDIISEGRDAWETFFGTVNLGKYFLGFGSLGICEHAFAEAFAHLHGRILYGKAVVEMPHIRVTVALAFARLVAMKFYAYRALDYLQTARADERRYLLYTAVQKAKVSTEGVKVMDLLYECVGARGLGGDTYFEMALRDTRLIPGLEGSTHINFGLTAQFIDPYFTGSEDVASPPSVVLSRSEAAENPYLFEADDRNAKTVRFAPFQKAYEPLRAVQNVRSFGKQVRAFQLFAAGGTAALNPMVDAGLFIGMGKCLSIIAYAQLVAENCVLAGTAPSTVSVIFHGLMEDISAEALKLSAMFPPGSTPRVLLKQIIRVPKTSAADLEEVSAFIAARYG